MKSTNNVFTYGDPGFTLDHVVNSINSQQASKILKNKSSHILNSLYSKQPKSINIELGNSPSFWLLGTARLIVIAENIRKHLMVNSHSSSIRYVTNYNLQPLNPFARSINLLNPIDGHPLIEAYRLNFISKKKFYQYQGVDPNSFSNKNLLFSSQNCKYVFTHFSEVIADLKNQSLGDSPLHIGEFIDRSNQNLMKKFFSGIEYSLDSTTRSFENLLSSYDVAAWEELDNIISTLLSSSRKPCWLSNPPKTRIAVSFSEARKYIDSGTPRGSVSCRVEFRQFLSSMASSTIRLSGAIYEYAKESDYLLGSFLDPCQIPLRLAADKPTKVIFSDCTVRQDIQLITLVQIGVNINLNQKFYINALTETEPHLQIETLLNHEVSLK